MNRNVLDKLYWVFWCTTTILTGILAGYMISHSIMLGRFFNWYIESGNEELLRLTFTVFRAVHNPQVPYYVPLYLSFVSGIIWTALAFIAKKDRIIAAIAGLATFWVGGAFFISDLSKAEVAVLSGLANPDMTRYYLSINLPIHSLFAAFYIISLFLLLLVAMKGRNGSLRAGQADRRAQSGVDTGKGHAS